VALNNRILVPPLPFLHTCASPTLMEARQASRPGLLPLLSCEVDGAARSLWIALTTIDAAGAGKRWQSFPKATVLCHSGSPVVVLLMLSSTYLTPPTEWQGLTMKMPLLLECLAHVGGERVGITSKLSIAT
jgi:hypothetical protein